MQYNKNLFIPSLLLFISPIFLAGLFLQACQGDNLAKVIQKQSSHSILISSDSIILKANQGLFYYQNKPFTGTSISYYPNGNPATKIQFLNGKKEGLYQKFYPNKGISFEANYKNGRQNGTIKTWWKDGILRSEANKKNGVVEGLQTQWYASGAKFKEMNYVNGKEEGLQKAWRENGKIYNNYEAKNGRIFGLKRASLCYELEDEIVQFEDEK